MASDTKDDAVAESRARAECHVIIFNLQSKKNVGTLVRTCVALGVTRIHVIGRRKLITHGNQLTNRFMEFSFYDSMAECRQELKSQGFAIFGVEISPTSHRIQDCPFSGNTAFLLGNEASGLSEQQLAFCDGLVYIPQYGAGTASLNVYVAAGIVLHRFACWAGFSESARDGAKFVVDEARAVRSHNAVTAGRPFAEMHKEQLPAPAEGSGEAEGAARCAEEDGGLGLAALSES